MRKVGEVVPLHPVVEQLLLLNLGKGGLSDAVAAAVQDALDNVQSRGPTGPGIEAVTVLTDDRKVNLLHPPAEPASNVSDDPDHLDKKHSAKGTFTTEVTPMTHVALSNSCCFYIGDQCYCW